MTKFAIKLSVFIVALSFSILFLGDYFREQYTIDYPKDSTYSVPSTYKSDVRIESTTMPEKAYTINSLTGDALSNAIDEIRDMQESDSLHMEQYDDDELVAEFGADYVFNSNGEIIGFN